MDAHAAAPIVVVGGANTDVIGIPTSRLLAHDSNPGHISVSSGGVGRNIAENLARLGERVSLLTAFGGDAAGAALRLACERSGIDVAPSIVASDLPGAHYLAILDEHRDMSVAVNDMRVLDLLVPAVLEERAAVFEGAGLVVVDANIPAASIAWLATNVEAPIVLDPVSVPKAPRAAALLPRLAAVTPNGAEASELLGRKVHGLDEAVDAATEFVHIGCRAAFVTCGAGGTAWADRSGSGIVRAPEVTVVNASGAGDAFCAGVSWAMVRGADGRRAAAAGTALAAMALQDEETVSRRVTLAALSDAMKEQGHR